MTLDNLNTLIKEIKKLEKPLKTFFNKLIKTKIKKLKKQTQNPILLIKMKTLN